jgi:tRNA/rRNA methyltransferase
MLRCADGSYYVGHTDDLENRLREHRAGGKCAYTETRLPVDLVWSREFATREEALAAELRIKKWSRVKKRALSTADFDGLRSAAKKTDWVGHHERRERR